MATPEATPGVTPRLITKVSPELLEPLVTVVATLGDLGATARDAPLAVPRQKLRAELAAVAMGVRQALGDCCFDVTWLRQALTTALGTPGATTTTTSGGWENVASDVSEWLVKVTGLEGAWTRVAGTTERLQAACEAMATTGAATVVDMCHLKEKVAQSRWALQELLGATQSLPMTSEPDKVTAALEEHEARVTKATRGLHEATEAIEEEVMRLVAAMDAKGWGEYAEVAVPFLGRLLVACHGIIGFYRHLRCHLKAVEDTVATVAGGGPGVPEELLGAVEVAERLWGASDKLINHHLLGTLDLAVRLLGDGQPGVTKRQDVKQQCDDATAALKRLLSPP